MIKLKDLIPGNVYSIKKHYTNNNGDIITYTYIFKFSDIKKEYSNTLIEDYCGFFVDDNNKINDKYNMPSEFVIKSKRRTYNSDYKTLDIVTNEEYLNIIKSLSTGCFNF